MALFGGPLMSVVTRAAGLACLLAGVMRLAQRPTTRPGPTNSKTVSEYSPGRGKLHDSTLAPHELFLRLAPSVFVVDALNNQGSVTASGSAVALGPDEVVTNKHVIESADSLRVRQGSKTW